MKVLITGSTGMVGKGVLIECLESPAVESVTVINRHSLGLKHNKLREIIHQDFTNMTSVENGLNDIDVCFFCLGISSAGLSEAEYRSATFDITLNFAKTILNRNPGITFCYISGAGTDSTEKGRIMWARIKGETENALLSLPFKSSYMFRPAFIQPMKGVKSKTTIYKIFYSLLKPFYPLFKHFPKYVTTSEKLGNAMINAVSSSYEKHILESIDINVLAEKNPG